MQKKYCKNCHHPEPFDAKFCPNCGQRHDKVKVTLGTLFGELFETIFSLNSKVLRTPLVLFFYPGKLTRSYLEGKRSRYATPLRLFVVFSFLFFLSLMVIVPFDSNDNGVRDFSKLWIERTEARMMRTQLDSAELRLTEKMPNDNISAVFDSIRTSIPILRDTTKSDSISLLKRLNGEVGDNNIKIAYWDLLSLSDKQLLDEYKVEGYWSRLMVRQELRVVRSMRSLESYIVSKSSWASIIILPFIALWLKLLYIRRNRYYIEHLIFSLHTHAFVFMLGFLLLTGTYFMNYELQYFFVRLALIYLVGYLYLAQKNFYGQGWIKTFIKFLMSIFVHMIIFAFAMTFTAMLSLLFL